MKYFIHYSKKRPLKWFLAAFVASFSLACSYQPLFLSGDISNAVTITETRRAIQIKPVSGRVSKTGLLFYPGGLVDNHVYNEILADFAEAAGVTVVIVKMPANLAVFDIDAGSSVTPDYPEISTWVIAGHSLGGSMAAQTIKNNPSDYRGLIFMDSYPADGTSLKEWPGAVLSLYSSIEKVSDEAQMEKIKNLLPPSADWTDLEGDYPAETNSSYTLIHQIEGGSHSYFGTYGPQDGDYTPTITREAFHGEVVEYMTEFFTQNNWREE